MSEPQSPKSRTIRRFIPQDPKQAEFLMDQTRRNYREVFASNMLNALCEPHAYAMILSTDYGPKVGATATGNFAEQADLDAIADALVSAFDTLKKSKEKSGELGETVYAFKQQIAPNQFKLILAFDDLEKREEIPLATQYVKENLQQLKLHVRTQLFGETARYMN